MRGRSKALIRKRNQKLFERFIYWSEVQRRRFDDVLFILSEEEFFLSEATILRIISDNNDELQEMIKKHKEKSKDTKTIKKKPIRRQILMF